MIIRHTLRAALLASTCMLPLVAAHADDFDVGAAAPAAKAAPSYDNEISVGSSYNSAASFKYGQFSGDTKNGGTGIGDFLVRGRDAWDSGKTTYYEAIGSDLGLDSRAASLKYGEQGKWSAKVTYDGIPYWQSNNFHTVFDNTGSGSLAGGLTRAGSIAAVTPLQVPGCSTGISATATTTTVANCNPLPVATAATEAAWPSIANQLSVQNVTTQRDKVGGEFKYNLGLWSLSGTFTHEHKEGTKENSLVFNGTGQGYPNTVTAINKATTGQVGYIPANLNGNMMYFPEPVNYDNDRYVAQAAYNTKQMQAQLTYTYNRFTDNNTNFAAQDPFQTLAVAGAYPAAAAIGGSAGYYWNGGGLNAGMLTPSSVISGLAANTYAGYIPLTAAYSLPPSSSAHQFKAQGAYNNLPFNTRVSGTVQYGMQYQDDQFNPISNTPAIAAATPYVGSYAGLGNSLHGFAENVFANVQVTSRPLPKLDTKIALTVDERDNLTASKSFASILVDGTGSLNNAITNSIGYKFLREKAVAEVGYSILPETKITVGDTYSIKDSKYLNIDRNNENAVSARVNSLIVKDVSGQLGVTHSVRTAEAADPANAWLAWNTFYNAAGHPDPLGFVPFNESARTRDELKQSVDWVAARGLDLSLTSSLANDNYPSHPYGVKSDHQVEVNPNVGFSPSAQTKYNLFYSFQENYSGATFSPTAGLPWTSKTTDTAHTVGAAASWKPVEKLKLSASYTFSYGDTAILTSDTYAGYSLANITATSGNCPNSPTSCSNMLAYYANMAPLPDTKNTMNSFKLSGEYEFNPALSLWTGYAFQKLSSSDWTYSQTAVSANYYNMVLAGDGNPSYTVHSVGAALRVKF